MLRICNNKTTVINGDNTLNGFFNRIFSKRVTHFIYKVVILYIRLYQKTKYASSSWYAIRRKPSISKSWSNRIELPSGKVRKTDTTILDTAYREFLEETSLPVDIQNLKPFTVRYHQDGKGGLQFLTEIPPLSYERTDEFGRGYIAPLSGTDNGRTTMLICEPLEVFMDRDLSLLQYSKNPWAVDDYIKLTLLLNI